MTVRDTSLAAYWSERANMRIANQASIVLEELHMGGPATRSDLVVRTGLKINAVCGRVKELLDMGLIVELGQVLDTETNKMVYQLGAKELP